VGETSTPGSTFSPTLTATLTPTFTPTVTVASPAFGEPVLSAQAFHYQFDCVPTAPTQVTIQVALSNAAPGESVYFFYRLQDVSKNSTTDWNNGLPMTGQGGGMYQITIAWKMIPDIRGLHGDTAEFEYQFVASAAAGGAPLRSPVYMNIQLSACK
jgi:hypothetical protein